MDLLHQRIASLRGTRAFTYRVDVRLLRFVRIALHLACRINQHFHSGRQTDA